MAEVVSDAQIPRKTSVNRRICLNEDSMFLKLLNSIILILFTFLLFQEYCSDITRGSTCRGTRHIGHFGCRIVNIPVIGTHASGLNDSV